MLAKSLARSIGCSLQADPVHARPAAQRRDRRLDLQPEERRVRVPAGPVVAQIVLADEINRATPKTQAALLEAMEEQQVTVDGITTRSAAPVHGARDAEPDRVRGHVPAARGPARPLHAAGAPGLPEARRGDQHPRPPAAHPPDRLAGVGNLRGAASRGSARCPRRIRRRSDSALRGGPRKRDAQPS